MFRSPATPATSCRPVWIVVGMVVGALSASTVSAQQAAQPAANTRLFPADGAIVLNFIKPDKTADFEAAIAKLKEALQKSEKPERKQQAASWKVFKSPDPAGANVLYVFVIDPAVKGADYQISNLILEAFPAAAVATTLTKYAEAYAQGINIVNLALVSEMGK